MTVKQDRWVVHGLLLAFLVLIGCAAREPVPGEQSKWVVKTEVGVPESRRVFIQEGMASWYGGTFHGRTSASGEVYDKWEMTAAHRTLPMGTRLVVEHVGNGRTVEVKINDRGPYIEGRIIDLSRAAASQLGMLRQGVAWVRLYRIGRPKNPEARGKFSLQVGPYHRLDHARKHVVWLSQHARPVRMTIDPDGEIIIHVGRFETRKAAKARASDLRERGYDPRIVTRDPDASSSPRALHNDS